MISIIDYGMGNLGSILNMYKRLNIDAMITSDLEDIRRAKKILLPGVGAFDAAMQRINDSGFRKILDHKALIEKIPILGVCLGMQLLTDSSEEGKLGGLGWIPARTVKFNSFNGSELKVPHMGWNTVLEINKSLLTLDLPEEPRFYFVHSYYVYTNDLRHVVMKTHYGIEFDSIIQKENIFGAQFHPEKSHKFGMKLLENFANI